MTSAFFKLYRLIPLIAITAVFLIHGCGKSRVPEPQHKDQKLPRRIVSLTPNNTEILFALGLGDKVVGVTKYCDYPPQVKSVPKVGDMNISRERVVALKPDLVLAHSYMNDNAIKPIEDLGVNVIKIDPKTFAETESDIKLIGRATGTERKADELVRNMESVIQKVKNESVGRKGASALVIIQTNPLWVAGPNTFVDEMIRIANGSNIAYDAKPGFNLFSMESAIARDPEVVVVLRKSDRDFIMRSSVWRKTKAVAAGRVTVIDSDILVRASPRLTQGLEELASALRTDNSED